MGYPMMAMSACFGGPMLSTLPARVFGILMGRYSPWSRCIRINHELVDRGRISRHYFSDTTRFDDLIIYHVDEYVDCCTVE